MQLSTNAPEPAYHLGLIYIQQGKIEQAQKLLQQAIKISPQYPEAQYSLGSILFSQGNLDGAIEAFRQAAFANSNYANAYYAAGLAFLRQNRLGEAQQVLQYARDLYKAQDNPEWARRTEQWLEQTQNPSPQSP
jgi:tetratricopeptide (TPR) repeat protein